MVQISVKMNHNTMVCIVIHSLNILLKPPDASTEYSNKQSMHSREKTISALERELGCMDTGWMGVREREEEHSTLANPMQDNLKSPY